MTKRKLYGIAGRPPKNPENKVGTPVRALVTIGIAELLAELSDEHGIPNPEQGLVSSDIVRLYLYYGLVKDGKMTEELEQDATWDTLKARGLL